MVPLRPSILLVFLTLISYAATSGLVCFEGEDTCSKWKNVDSAEYGTFNGKILCCPPEPDQAILLNGIDDCRCLAGTAEKHNANDNSESSAVRAHYLVSLAVVLASVFLF